MSEIRRGALLSYATILIINLSGLLLTPVIIRGLGNAEYGLYMLIGALAAGTMVGGATGGPLPAADKPAE